MLNNWRRLFHSPRVKFPLVNRSAIWCLVSTYLIWILGSRWILSNNQSRATLWVLDTSLIVGLRPLIIILITASLSSKTHNKALEPECVPLDGTWSMLVRSRLVFVVRICFACLTWELPTSFLVALLNFCCWFGLVRNEILQSLNPKELERESHPCVNLHREKLLQLL